MPCYHMRLFVAITTEDVCTIGFATSVIQLRQALQSAPNVQAAIDFVPDLETAFQKCKNMGDVDVMAVLSSQISFPARFILRSLVAPHPFIAAIYPLAQLDWNRVQQKALVPGEDMRFKGNKYNFDPSLATPVTGQYIAVRSAELKAMVLKRDAIDKVSGVKCTKDICKAWGKDIHMDLIEQCANFGPMEFSGCIGVRVEGLLGQA